MKKRDLKKLALMGLTGGLLLGQQQAVHAAVKNDNFQETPFQETPWEKAEESHFGLVAVRDQPEDKDQKDQDPNDSNMGYHLMTDAEIQLELSDEGRRMYNSLDDEGKALARKVASMRCAKTNECKGLNACMTDKNTCAGKGDCKGQGKCGISDKNLAVKLVYDKMAAKRTKMLQDK